MSNEGIPLPLPEDSTDDSDAERYEEQIRTIRTYSSFAFLSVEATSEEDGPSEQK